MSFNFHTFSFEDMNMDWSLFDLSFWLFIYLFIYTLDLDALINGSTLF